MLDVFLAQLATLPGRPSREIMGAVKRQIERAGIAPFNCPVVTVTGTNGKTSCVRLLESAASAAGLRVGAFTSPHLFHFNERIQINQQSVPDHRLLNALLKAQKWVSGYFCVACLAALDLFAAADLDLIILEVGIGGRYDLTNIIDADIAVITSIGLDHQAVLGDTRDQIAWQKAGIMRPGRPVVIGEADVPPALEQCIRELNVSAYRASGCAAMVREIITLLNLELEDETFHTLVKNTQVTGRLMHRQSDRCRLLFDVAHNPQATTRLANNLTSKKKVKAVVGMLEDKRHVQSLQPLLTIVDHWYLSAPQNSRALPAKQLHAIVQSITSAPAVYYDDLAQAFNAAYEDASREDLIVVFGSCYTVAECLQLENVGGVDGI